jgi:TRAP-type C4-dicarboxylate transport system permease small subunit
MEKILNTAFRISQWMDFIAVAALTFMMSLTMADVICRSFGSPIIGTYEIVGLSSAITIGFAVPFTSWKKGHVFMDFVVDRLSATKKIALMVVTRLMVILLFIFIGVNLFMLGHEYYVSREVSQTIRMPIYPFVYAVAVVCFIECYVILCEMLKVVSGRDAGGQHE